MRASLAAHLRRALAGGRLGLLARGAVRAAAARFDLSLPGPLAGPLLATFAITYRCPLACAMCDLPSRAHNELSDAEVLRFVAAIADLAPLGLGFTGGEPLVRDVLFPAIDRAVARGIVTHLNTSGVGMSDQRAKRLIESGIASINVSIDHHDAAEHDRLRGRPRALEHALNALRRLSEARSGSSHRPRLAAMMAISRDSIAQIAAVRTLVLEHGADALSILPVHDFTADHGASIVAAHGITSRPDPAATRNRDDQPVDLSQLGLENSLQYLAGVMPFLEGAATPGACSASRSALFLDPRGKLFACTPGATLDRDGIQVEPDTLARVVRSGALTRTVPKDQCARCWWNCHRELDIAIGRDRMRVP